MKYIPDGVCSKRISFSIIDGKLNNVKFVQGCPGNAQGIAKLVEGMDATDVAKRLKGIKCQNGTSCPDQLAIAIESSLK
ncbi:TIGR03905 family TSCPD domain-containing protein [Desulfosporosinus sp.]|uniref:TIGR03905 family TSCPD domain-containing protein n=1 Tax=Desulfosporosinus sp. TaxID=157907 RepID=UPI002318DB9B|nr:TIGR03905 family TSCPD domain-containing protein [Desulfosporosinus sp.]MCO5387461.1 TIGR03905 family TSCPD domain-containing protein [Desulfosporosinus sp.]MDA8220850.1 TIGR03905 family TSCPD domain-containing protein [Desulfitobacterium hafniense]